MGRGGLWPACVGAPMLVEGQLVEGQHRWGACFTAPGVFQIGLAWDSRIPGLLEGTPTVYVSTVRLCSLEPVERFAREVESLPPVWELEDVTGQHRLPEDWDWRKLARTCLGVSEWLERKGWSFRIEEGPFHWAWNRPEDRGDGWDVDLIYRYDHATESWAWCLQLWDGNTHLVAERSVPAGTGPEILKGWIFEMMCTEM